MVEQQNDNEQQPDSEHVERLRLQTEFLNAVTDTDPERVTRFDDPALFEEMTTDNLRGLRDRRVKLLDAQRNLIKKYSPTAHDQVQVERPSD